MSPARRRQALVLVLLLAGLGALALPQLLLRSFAELATPEADARWLVRGFGLVLLALAPLPLSDAQNARQGAIWAGGFLVLAFLAMAQVLAGWWIDDAGITMSYARSLAEGAGLTFAPWDPPTEGYSSTLWMAMLALAGAFGAEIALAAKYGGLLAAVVAMALVMVMVWRATHSPAAVAFAGTLMLGAPQVIWATSGQEHALQGLLLLGVVALAGAGPRWPLWAGGLLALLVLTRPEAPLVVMTTALAVLIHDSARWGRFAPGRALPIVIVPLVAFCALLAFRLWYFNEALPNPYHAKASESGFAGLVNPFGGGWHYLMGGMLQTGLVLAVPVLLLGLRQVAPIRVAVLWGVAAGQVGFVLWAKGDWMAGWRFVMPLIPLLALAAGLALMGFSPRRRRVAAMVLGLGVTVASLGALQRFAAAPTTPMAAVAAVGAEFASLGARLGISEPLLAHHDAGAIGYQRSLRLVDLGGLVDPVIARNMTDRAAMIAYVVDERRPDFVFGARNFAAATGFHESAEFTAAYVPLFFPDQPFMQADLAFVRRDHLPESAVEGITLRDGVLEIRPR